MSYGTSLLAASGYKAKTSAESYGPFRSVRFDGTSLRYHLIKQCHGSETESVSQKGRAVVLDQPGGNQTFSVRCFC